MCCKWQVELTVEPTDNKCVVASAASHLLGLRYLNFAAECLHQILAINGGICIENSRLGWVSQFSLSMFTEYETHPRLTGIVNFQYRLCYHQYLAMTRSGDLLNNLQSPECLFLITLCFWQVQPTFLLQAISCVIFRTFRWTRFSPIDNQPHWKAEFCDEVSGDFPRKRMWVHGPGPTMLIIPWHRINIHPECISYHVLRQLRNCVSINVKNFIR